MANKKIETMTFNEIWTGLNADDRNELSRRLLLARCCTTYQTVWNWGTKKVRPSSALVRNTIASTVSKFFGTKTTDRILFPLS